jgi:hypothetical protein
MNHLFNLLPNITISDISDNLVDSTIKNNFWEQIKSKIYIGVDKVDKIEEIKTLLINELVYYTKFVFANICQRFPLLINELRDSPLEFSEIFANTIIEAMESLTDIESENFKFSDHLRYYLQCENPVIFQRYKDIRNYIVLNFSDANDIIDIFTTIITDLFVKKINLSINATNLKFSEKKD